MKILAFNGSPKGEKSITEVLVKKFMEGATEAGAEVETVYLAKKNIESCKGCFQCWVTGECFQDDDMPELIKKVLEADVIIYATPLYVFTVSGLLKNFMDRSSVSIMKSDIIRRGNQFIHPMANEEYWPKKTVLISNAGYPERHHFDGIVETFKILTTSVPEFKHAGNILCPAGPVLALPNLKEKLQWYLEAVKRAGKEVVEKGEISFETQEILERNLIDPAIYAKSVTDLFNSYKEKRQGSRK